MPPAAASRRAAGGGTNAGGGKRSFQILTYNVWIAPLVRWNPSENLAKICAFMLEQQADVICMQEVFDWKLGPIGKLCEVLFQGGTGCGPLSYFFYFEGLLLPFFNTGHQRRITEAMKDSYPFSLPSKPVIFGHNQGLLVLSKHPLTHTHCTYQKGVIVHRMGWQRFSVCIGNGDDEIPTHTHTHTHTQKDDNNGHGEGISLTSTQADTHTHTHTQLLRCVNLHLIPNFETHPWKGRLLSMLGERNVKEMQKEQMKEVAKEVRGDTDKWCVIGDFNHDGPQVQGVGSRVTEVTCPKESHILDHFVTPLPYTYKVFPDNTLSDHYPVLATFNL